MTTVMTCVLSFARNCKPNAFNHHGFVRKLSEDNRVRVWEEIRQQALLMHAKEELLRPLLEESLLNHKSFIDALYFRLSTKITGRVVTAENWMKIFMESLARNHLHGIDIEGFAIYDLLAIKDRDPACDDLITAFLYFKGYKALQCHRIANAFYVDNRREIAYLIQSRSSEVFGVDIHPAAKIGKGIMIDHATGLVIGETAVVGDNCSFLHGVTLGGTGKVDGQRHPKLGSNVVVGCGASILGNINIGNNVKIGSGSMILKDIPDNKTVVGNPSKILN